MVTTRNQSTTAQRNQRRPSYTIDVDAKANEHYARRSPRAKGAQARIIRDHEEYQIGYVYNDLEGPVTTQVPLHIDIASRRHMLAS